MTKQIATSMDHSALRCSVIIIFTALLSGTGVVDAQPINMTTITVQANQQGKPISPDLFGAFFEDLNYAADGGLYAELVQNRSFEYSPTEQRDWHPLKFWELQKRGGGDWRGPNAAC